MRLDIRGSQELQDVVRAIRSSDREVRSAIRAYTKAEITRPWMQAMGERVQTRLEGQVLARTATVAVSDQNIRIQSASKGRRLSGGLNPKVDYPAVEFGSKDRAKTSRYRRKSRSGGTHNVKRRTRAQFRPHRQNGYVFYPAAQEMIPRLASLWVQTVVKTYADIFEGRK